jgi:flavin reductase (DIM6/NTAB) family NADH-FMN oxidoreductase RutF
MAKIQVPYTDLFEHVMAAMTSRGLLLGSYDAQRKPNLMTIGWGAIGNIWGIPAWMVLVRPSRYTYACIEHSSCFSVNVPGEDLGMACAICGSRSGRDTDKVAQAKLTVDKGSHVLAPVVRECPVVYECQVVHAHDVLPEKLAGEILNGAYLDGDYHRVYYGKILGIRIAPDAAARLGR